MQEKCESLWVLFYIQVTLENYVINKLCHLISQYLYEVSIIIFHSPFIAV